MDTTPPTTDPSNTDIAREAAACGLPPEQFDEIVGGDIVNEAPGESENGADSLTQGLSQA